MKPVLRWLTEDRTFWIALVLAVIALAFAWFTSPVAAAIREALA